MKVNARPYRLELKPETDQEKAALQAILDAGTIRGDLMFFWGDSDAFGDAFQVASLPTKAMSAVAQVAAVPAVERVNWALGARVRAALKRRVVARLAGGEYSREEVEQAFEDALAVSGTPFRDWLLNGGFERLIEIAMNLLKLFSEDRA